MNFQLRSFKVFLLLLAKSTMIFFHSSQQQRVFKFETRIPVDFQNYFVSGKFQKITLQSLLEMSQKQGCFILEIEMRWLEISLCFEAKNFDENSLILEFEDVLKRNFSWSKDLFEHPVSCERVTLFSESSIKINNALCRKPDLRLGF